LGDKEVLDRGIKKEAQAPGFVHGGEFNGGLTGQGIDIGHSREWRISHLNESEASKTAFLPLFGVAKRILVIHLASGLHFFLPYSFHPSVMEEPGVAGV
jgi:hypothetical protein